MGGPERVRERKKKGGREREKERKRERESKQHSGFDCFHFCLMISPPSVVLWVGRKHRSLDQSDGRCVGSSQSRAPGHSAKLGRTHTC